VEGSPAERCGVLHIGDRVIAVNGLNVSNMHHEHIVNIIKDSGCSVVLTIGPPGKKPLISVGVNFFLQ
jgi:atrophin-1 interacting protein 3 (BAI1-associated protein 1)